jgi:hypothetical protein
MEPFSLARDTSMATVITISFLLGSLVAWSLSQYLYAERKRRYLRETTPLMQRSITIQDQFYAITAMVYLDALRAVESGDLENAKRDLAMGAAGFYHQFSGLNQYSEVIERRKREVEHLARKSKALKAALQVQHRRTDSDDVHS